MANDWKRIDCGNGKSFEYKVDLIGTSDFTDKNIYQTTIRTEFGTPFRSLGTITQFLPWLKNIGVKCENEWEDKYFYTVSAPHYNPSEEDKMMTFDEYLFCFCLAFILSLALGKNEEDNNERFYC